MKLKTPSIKTSVLNITETDAISTLINLWCVLYIQNKGQRTQIPIGITTCPTLKNESKFKFYYIFNPVFDKEQKKDAAYDLK